MLCSCEENSKFLYIMDDAVEEGQEHAAAAAGAQPVPPCVVILPEVCRYHLRMHPQRTSCLMHAGVLLHRYKYRVSSHLGVA